MRENFRWVILFLGICQVQFASAQEEYIEQPAGEIPDAMPDETKPQTDVKTAKNEQEKSNDTAEVLSEGSENDVSWDSYDAKGQNTSKQKATAIRVEDIVEPPSDYRYAAFGKGDPFVPPLITEELMTKSVSALEIPLLSPLQKYELSELSLVGIWQLASGERKAMIMTPGTSGEGTQGIIVRGGDPVGKRGGRILAVGDNFLTVREFRLAEDGSRQFSDQQMFMGQRPRETISDKIRFEPGAQNPQLILDDSNPSMVNQRQDKASRSVNGVNAGTDSSSPRSETAVGNASRFSSSTSSLPPSSETTSASNVPAVSVPEGAHSSPPAKIVNPPGPKKF